MSVAAPSQRIKNPTLECNQDKHLFIQDPLHKVIEDTLFQMPINLISIIGSYANDSLYGPEAWKIWKVEILDAVPKIPQVNLRERDKVLLYIPQTIRVDGKEPQELTLNTLLKISGVKNAHFTKYVKRQFGNNTAPGWVLIDKNVIFESRGQDYETQERMVVERGCNMPSLLEAAVLNLMVFAFTGERLYGQMPCTYTRCTEKFNGQYPVVYGGFSSEGFDAFSSSYNSDYYGVACAQRNF